MGGRPGRIHRPSGTGPHPTLVYLHGGGFVMGDLDTHDRTCRDLCTGAETVGVSVAYRLAPEHPFPAAVDDAVAATEWAARKLDSLGGSYSPLRAPRDVLAGRPRTLIATAAFDPLMVTDGCDTAGQSQEPAQHRVTRSTPPRPGDTAHLYDASRIVRPDSATTYSPACSSKSTV